MDYSVTVDGFDGELTASVFFGAELLDSFSVNSVKDAQRKARSIAARHRADSFTGRTSFTETFQV